MVSSEMFKRAYCAAMMTYIATKTIMMTIVDSTFGYIKAVILAYQLKGPPAKFLLGNGPILLDKNAMENVFKPSEILYGRVFRLWLSVIPFFVVKHPDDLRIVLSSKKHTQKSFIYDFLHNFLGNGLITNSAEKWASHRRLIQPTFNINILQQFLDTFVDASNVFVQRIKASDHSELNITSFVNRCVIDILNESVLGVPISAESSTDLDKSPYRQGKVVLPTRMAKPWLLFDWTYNLTKTSSSEMNQKQKMDAFTQKMITIRRDAMKNGDVPMRKCLLDYLIEISEKDPQFTDADIVNEASTFMLAGQDSVGAATAFCLFMLTQHPGIQQKCVDELSEIFKDDDRTPTMTDIGEMRFLEQCVKETLRLYPSVSIFARKISEDVICGNYTIPSGSNVVISPYATHHNEAIYPNPERFDPDRFSAKQCEERHPYAFIPFSAGPRNCIGFKFAYIEIKAIISTILREFELLPIAGKTQLKPVARVTVRASGGLHIKFKSRKCSASVCRPL